MVARGRSIARWTMCVCVAALLCPHSLAVEPPRTGAEEALPAGQVAFLARAVGIKELASSAFETRVEMELAIAECYYGLDCGDRVVRFIYVSQSCVETALSVDFPVGREILFVLHAKLEESRIHVFDSDVRGGVDLAFLGNRLPKYGPDLEGGQFESVFTGTSEKLTYTGIRRLGDARRLWLEGAEKPTTR
jgi:hypothetical protein